MLIYLVIHDSQVPLERGGCLWLLLGRNRFSSVAGRCWSRSVTRAVVNQHETGNYGDDDDAANPLALEGQRRDMSRTGNHLESIDRALGDWIWGKSCIFLEGFSVQVPSSLTDAASLLFTHARVQMNKMSVMSPKCFQHSLQRTSTHAEIKTSPENYGDMFKRTKGGKINKWKHHKVQSALSRRNSSSILNSQHKGSWQQCFPQTSFLITVPLSSSSSLPLVSRLILHGPVARAPLSSRASGLSLQHPCTLQASLEPETRCYTTLLPLSSPHSVLMVLNRSDSKLTSLSPITRRSASSRTDLLEKVKYVPFRKCT